MVLVDAAGRLMGMMTDRDLRSLWARGGDGDQPVRTLAWAKPVSVQMDATGFEALSVMAKNNIHHLPVLDKWNLKGVITARDLLLRQGANPVSVVKDVASAASPDQLVGLRAKVDRLVKVLIRRNLSAADVLDVVNHINDRLIRRVMDLSLAALEDEGHGAPPAPWALVGLGAAGRKEQVLGTGLSLGLVFADGDGDDNRRRDAWFSVLADRLDDGLKRAGFQIPPQGPSNDRNRRSRPVSDWQNDFKAWIRRPDPETLKWAAPFFDGRLIAGREDLVHDVIRAGRRELTDNPDFMTALARSAVRGPDRLGWFHGRLVDDRGRPAPGAGLEEAGLRPLVDAVRTLSLARRLPPTNTLDRLTALRESGALDPTMAQDAADAYACLFKARLVRFLENPDRPWFDPPHLPFYSDPARNQAIKEALAAVRRIRDRIRGRWLAAAA
jgi:CBS domain-containing protein